MKHSRNKKTSKLAVQCVNVTKDFGFRELRTRALNKINFSAEVGEMTFVVGPSGCGKTTLLSIITGILSADGGEVSVLGSMLSDLKQSNLAIFRSHNIGYVFQQFNLIPALTAIENVAVPLNILRVHQKQASYLATELLSKLGMEQHLHKFPSELSAGQQQRVAIARAIIHQPKLIVCDEPTAALDANASINVMHLLRKYALNSENSIIVVTHDSRISQFADQIETMADGRIIVADNSGTGRM